MQSEVTSGNHASAVAREQRIALAAAVSIVTILFAPRMTHGGHLVLVLLPLAALWRARWDLQLQQPTLLASALAVFGVYIAINASFAVDPLEAYGKVSYYWVLLLSTILAIAGLPRLSHDRISAMARGVLIGFVLGSIFLAIETVFNQPFRRFLFNILPAVRMAPKHITVSADIVSHIGLYTLNRNLAILSLAIWPALLLMRTIMSDVPWRIAAVGCLAITGLAVFSSEHETSMLALLFSTVAFLGMLAAPKIMRALILAGWLVATLAVVPIAAMSYAAGLHKSNSIPQTGRNRIIIWGVTANEIRKAPLLGIGVGSTKELDEKAAPTAAKPDDYGYALRTGRHSHNIFMQAWYELGAIGAILFSATGIAGLFLMRRLRSNAQPYAHAAFVSAVLIGAFSWGMWQTWFMAAYAIWAILLAVSLEAADRKSGAELPDSPA